MVRKTDEIRLQEIDERLEELKAMKQKVASRIQSKERKDRTRRLIQVGAIFEKYFNIIGEDQAEKVAYGMKDAVEKHKDKLLSIDVEKSERENTIVYEIQEERLIIPEGEKPSYQV